MDGYRTQRGDFVPVGSMPSIVIKPVVAATLMAMPAMSSESAPGFSEGWAVVAWAEMGSSDANVQKRT